MTELPAENTAQAAMTGAIRAGQERRQAMQGDVPPGSWSPKEVALLVRLGGGDDTPAQVFWRTIDAGRVGEYLATLTLLAGRGMLTVVDGEARLTNLGLETAVKLASQRGRE